MKNDVFWGLLFAVLVSVAGWNIYENRQLKQMPVPDDGNLAVEEILSARAYELSYTGRVLKWPDGLQVMGESALTTDSKNWGLVLAIDEMSCDVCRDEQTQFALELAREVGFDSVRIVVHAKQQMYARSYMRLNQIPEGIFYDKDGVFFSENQLGRAPLLMLHNPEGMVIATHYPLPGKPEVSEPFHKFVRQFFGVSGS